MYLLARPLLCHRGHLGKIWNRDKRPSRRVQEERIQPGCEQLSARVASIADHHEMQEMEAAAALMETRDAEELCVSVTDHGTAISFSL